MSPACPYRRAVVHQPGLVRALAFRVRGVAKLVRKGPHLGHHRVQLR